MDRLKQNEVIKGAAITGVINAFINAAIQYFSLKDKAPILLSVDSITNNVETVLGGAVSLAISLAMMSTVIAYLNIKDLKVKFFPVGFWSVIKHGFFAFGVTTSLAVIWQRYMGSVEVSLVTALLIIGVIAGLVSGLVNYMTLKACIIYEEAEGNLAAPKDKPNTES